jgi:hypothetical protein
MTEGTNVVAVYPDHQAAEQAVAKLRDASFDVTKLSIIGKDSHGGENTVGYYTTGESMKYWGLRGALRGGIWGLLLGAGFFLIPGVGSVLVAGPFLGALLTGLESAAIVGGSSAIAVGLIHIGIAKEKAIEYENALIADKFLLIANVLPEDVARAQQVLGISAPSEEYIRPS